MSWFKNDKETKPELAIQQDEDAIRQLPDDDISREAQGALKDYERGVSANWKLTVPAVDDAMTVTDVRDYLHILYTEAARRSISLDTNKLRELDIAWQHWLLKRIPLDVIDRTRFYPNNDQIPREQWWWYIEELDKLSDEQRSTL